MRGDTWDDYRVVLALARRGSISAAARELNVDDTTVVRRLSRLERSLGATLFERLRGQVVPTAAAAGLLRRLARVDDELAAARDEASGANARVAGRVRVTAVPMITTRALVPRLGVLLEAHPALEVELVVDSALLGITRARDADIAVRGTRPDSDPDALTRKLGRMTYGVYCRRDLVDRDVEPGWVGYADRHLGRRHARWIEARLTEQGAIARARADDTETLLQCLLLGLGKSLCPDALAVRFPELVRLEPGTETPARELWMLMHPSWREVQRVRTVAAWVADSVREFLSATGPGAAGE